MTCDECGEEQTEIYFDPVENLSYKLCKEHYLKAAEALVKVRP